jgi:hypothetical protein
MMQRFVILCCLITIASFSNAQHMNVVQPEQPADDMMLHSKKAKPVPPWFVERFKISVGAFFPINNTSVQLGLQNGQVGTVLDFEKDLGFRRNTATFLADFQWRASRRSRFDLSYYRVARQADYRLKKDIKFGEHQYNVDAVVDAHFNTNIIRFSYGYSLFTRPKGEVGLLIGAHIVDLDAGLALIGNNVSASVEDNFGITAPLPDLGIWGGYAFSPKWSINGEADYFSIRIGDYKGRIIAYQLGVQYLIIQRLTASVGYTGLNARLDADKDRLKGYFKWGYNGPSITVSYAFGKKNW